MTPLVLVHGFMGGSAQWAHQAPLWEDGRPWLAVDLPGFGKNADLAPLSRIEDFAAWVLERAPERFDLLGHSMGGMIAQEMVRQAPGRVDRLVLYSTGPIGEVPGRFEPMTRSMARAEADGAVATARRISATWFLEEEAARDYPACSAIAEAAGLGAILGGLRAMEAWSGVDHLDKIDTETLVLWGDRDRTYQWAQTELLWRGIPRSSLAVVPGCAHAVHMERWDVFNRLLDGFLRA